MKRVFITGASRGIGQAIAARLAEEKSEIIVTGRDRSGLEKTCEMVRSRGAEATPLVADLANREELESLVSSLKANPPDVLVNNAGIAVISAYDKITIEDWDRILAVNVTAPFLLTKGLGPLMTKGSSIVNILSLASYTPFAEWSAYCMTKYALDGFAKSVREELRPKGIRVINVYPAATATDIWDTIPGDWPKDAMISPNEVAEAVVFAVNRPTNVLVSDVHVGSIGGAV